MKIGLLSFAHPNAHRYAHGLRHLPDVELVGIQDAQPQRGRPAAREFDTPYCSTVEELLTLGLDGVIICSETVHHRPLVELAAGRVPYLLLEQPFAPSLADARAILAVCAHSGAQLQVAFPKRFSPPLQRLKEVLDQEALGKLYCAKCASRSRLPEGWLVDRALAAGGSVLHHSTHIIDLLRWFWHTEISEVYAEVGYGLLHPTLNVEDAGLLSFTLANGVYGTLDASWSHPASYPTPGDFKIEIIGDKGMMALDLAQQSFAVSADATGQTRRTAWGSDDSLGLIVDFVETIRQGRTPSITGEDGLRALEVALAAYRSAEAKTPVQLPLNE